MDDMVDGREYSTWRLKGAVFWRMKPRAFCMVRFKRVLWAVKNKNEWSPTGSVVAGKVLVPYWASHGLSAESS